MTNVSKTAKTAAKSSKKVASKKVAVKKAAANARRLITDAFTIKVLSKKIPFTGPVQVKNAERVLASKTVAEAKKKGADSWTIRALEAAKVIEVNKPKAA